MKTILTTAAVATLAGIAAAQTTTHRFDLPTVPLAVFGLSFHADHLGPPMATIVDARANLTLTTRTMDAATLVITIQAPSTGVPFWHLKGSDLGWSGTGTFRAQVSTSMLNGPIDLGYPVPTASLFGIDLARTPLAPMEGQFTASHFEIDVVPWTDVGGGAAGTSGRTPKLIGTGALVPQSTLTLTTNGARPNATAGVVIGLARVDRPLLGGLLVPSTELFLSGFTVDPTGALAVQLTWPSGIASGHTLFFQTWLLDPAGPAGVAASNGLGILTP